MTSVSNLSLGRHYGSDDEEKKSKAEKKRKHHSKTPMETRFGEEFNNPTEVKFDMSFNEKIQGLPPKPVDFELFDIESLFSAVSSGDVNRLKGLEKFLEKKNTSLTYPEYQSDGKTALIKALLNLKDGENKIVEYLLEITERLHNNTLNTFVNTARTDTVYKGQTALHIAIERRNKHYVELLIQKRADVHAKACGTFFQPLNETCFYFGELPLSLAACTNQKDIVDLLMDKADVRYQDTLGNTVLHALVMVADNSPENTDIIISMYDYILTKDAAKNPNEKKLEDIENKQGLTSIKLAAKLGKIGLLKHILHRMFPQEECRHLSRKFTEWAYGPVYASLFDLDSVDTNKPNSILEIVVYGAKIPNRLEMLQMEPLKKLLEDKWNKFARWMFFFKFIVYLIYLIIFTAVSYHHEEGTPPIPVATTYLLCTGGIIMAIGSVYFTVTVLIDLYVKRPCLQTLLEDGYCDLLFLLQAGLFIICAMLYGCGKQEYLAFLVLSLALCWINLLYYSRGNRHMGIYNVMIQRILLSDILRFLIVYMVFLFGFSAAVLTLLKEPDKGGLQKPTFKTISFTTLELFKFTIGMGDLEFTKEYEYTHVFYVLLISYLVLTYILLLNMLIALMSKTVDTMKEKSTSIWKLQRAITILDLERFAHKNFSSGVWINLSKNMDDLRWCLRVEEANWNDWNRNLGIIREEPEQYKSITQTKPHKEISHCEVSQQRIKDHIVQVEQETEPLASSSV